MIRSGNPRGSRWPPTRLAAVCADHLGYLEGKQYAATTLTVRRVHLRLFCTWAAAQGLTEPAALTRPMLEGYQRYLVRYRTRHDAPLSLASQHARLTHLRVLGAWLLREQYLPQNPAADLELPRVGSRLPTVLSAAEVERVLQQPTRVRDRAILETFYSTGMRRTELARLTLADLDPARRLVTIRQGKGRKDRVVPIGERALAWVARYLAAGRPHDARGRDLDTVFLSRQGKPLTPNYLSALVREYVDGAQLGKRGACHLFRHAMATLMLEGGADIRFIQQMLGHADLTSTQLYTHVSIPQLQAVHTATHPAARLPVSRPARARIRRRRDRPRWRRAGGPRPAFCTAPSSGIL